MFKEIHRKLSMYYTVIMAIFFILLVFGVHKSMIWSITSEQEHEVLLFAEEEALEHAIFFQHRELLEGEREEDDDRRRLFFYAYDNEKNLINYANPSDTIRNAVLNKIENWQDGTGKIVTLKFDGEYKIMLSAMPIVANGETLGMIYVGRDVTTYYKGMRRATTIVIIVAILALIIAAIAGHIMAGKAMIPIKKAYDKQRQFTADASHELRTPLSVIMSSVEVMQQEEAIKKSPFILQIMNDMKDEIKKMSNLVGNLLTLARSEQQINQLNKKSFCVNEAVEQMVRKVSPLALEKSIRIEFFNKIQYELYADLERIQQLLLILLDNAIKYTMQNGTINILLMKEENNKKLILKITDTGIGIDDKDKALIFDRFYRVDKARSREAGGTGLGLAIAKWIVAMHEGDIRVESKVGEGTTFIVVLPTK